MEASNAEHLTDAEAAAVLLALGEPFEWQPEVKVLTHSTTPGKPAHVEGEIAEVESGFYLVLTSNDFWLVSDDFWRPWQFLWRLTDTRFEAIYHPYIPERITPFKRGTWLPFKTQKAAKRACEHHYATGKWN